MTEETILGYIDRLNKGTDEELTFTRELAENVLLAKVWDKEPDPDDELYHETTSYDFFFIKNGNGEVVGAVQDAKSDLHWVIAPKARKKGHLTEALRSTILPYIFCYCERDAQRITISKGIGNENYEGSRKVAESLGFVPVNDDESEFELTFENFAESIPCSNGKDVNISPERYKILRKRVRYASKLLKKVSDELIVGLENDKGLLKLANEIRYFNAKIEDLECSREN